MSDGRANRNALFILARTSSVFWCFVSLGFVRCNYCEYSPTWTLDWRFSTLISWQFRCWIDMFRFACQTQTGLVFRDCDVSDKRLLEILPVFVHRIECLPQALSQNSSGNSLVVIPVTEVFLHSMVKRLGSRELRSAPAHVIPPRSVIYRGWLGKLLPACTYGQISWKCLYSAIQGNVSNAGSFVFVCFISRHSTSLSNQRASGSKQFCLSESVFETALYLPWTRSVHSANSSWWIYCRYYTLTRS